MQPGNNMQTQTQQQRRPIRSSGGEEPTLDGFNMQNFCSSCDTTILSPASEACENCKQAKPHDGWPLDPRLGTNIVGGQYRVRRRIGSGGFGVVYEVQTVIGGLRRALKVLNRKWLDDSDVRGRFINEALVLEQVNHPNVARCFAAGTMDGDNELYLLLELVEGISLQQILEDPGSESKVIQPARAIRIARQIASGLVASHSKGILHRDLKPANIMVVAAGEPAESIKLVDFGIAKVATSKKTSKHIFMGTPQFMAPEQFDPSLGEISVALDFWQLGATLFTMLTGQAPRDDSGSLRACISGSSEVSQYRRSRKRAEQISGIPDVDRLVRKLMASDPGQRPTSAIAVCEELATLEHQISPGSTTSPTALIEVLTASPSRGSWRALCRHLHTQKGDVVERANSRLEAWPVELRGASLGWFEQIRRGSEEPKLWSLARNLNLSDRYLSDKDVMELAESEALATLESLSLAGNGVTDNGLAALAGSPHGKNLSSLDLSRTKVTAKGLQQLAESQYLRGLRSLKLSQTAIGADGAEVIAHSRWWLETLDLSECDLRTAGAQALARGAFRSLTDLRLGGNLLGADGIAALAASSILLLLKRLDLTRNAGGPSGAASLAMASGLHHLVHLQMAQNNLGKQGLHLLLSASSLERLETLDISSNSLGPSGALVLTSSPLARRLRGIDLSDNELEDAGLAALLGAPQLTGLRDLAVAQNQISASGVCLVGGAPLQLERLDLSANPIDPTRWNSMSEALGKTRVRSLNLAHMQLTGKGLSRILEGTAGRIVALDVSGNRVCSGFDRFSECPELASLTRLSLDSCSLSASELEKLCRSPYLSQLQRLSLNSNAISDRGCESLALAGIFPALRELMLQDNGITAQGTQVLARSPIVARLTHLDLSYNSLQDLGAENLSRGESLDNLQKLILKHSEIGMAGVASLNASRSMSMLQSIDLSENPLVGRLDLHGLTLKKVQVMESCYESLALAGVSFTRQFYEMLFERFPRVKPLFARVSMLRQQQHLFSALVMVIENLRNPESVEAGLRELGQRHVGYGVQASQYAAVSGVLLELLAESLGEAWTEEQQEAWSDGLEAVSQVMMNAHRQRRADSPHLGHA